MEKAAETVTVTLADAVPPEPVQLTEYVVDELGDTFAVPDTWLPVEKPVPVQLVAFVDDQESVTCCPDVTDVADAVRVAVGARGAEATTAVHAPQLLLSFDSEIVPAFAAELLSAQTRIYHVAAEGNEYESVALILPPAPSAEALCVPMSVALEPDASVAR